MNVFQSCLVVYYNLFYKMEDNMMLNVEDDIHMFCLHYVFIPRINHALQQFMEGWNNHPSRHRNSNLLLFPKE